MCHLKHLISPSTYTNFITSQTMNIFQTCFQNCILSVAESSNAVAYNYLPFLNVFLEMLSVGQLLEKFQWLFPILKCEIRFHYFIEMKKYVSVYDSECFWINDIVIIVWIVSRLEMCCLIIRIIIILINIWARFTRIFFLLFNKLFRFEEHPNPSHWWSVYFDQFEIQVRWSYGNETPASQI